MRTPGIKKGIIQEETRELIKKIRSLHPTAGAISIERYLKQYSIKLSHNKIHTILEEEGMAMMKRTKSREPFFSAIAVI